MKPVVYRFYRTDGSLLYIGSTADWYQRMGQHETGRPWWGECARIELEHHETIDAARAAEAEAIRREVPEHNSRPRSVAQIAQQRSAGRAATRHAAGQSCGHPVCVPCRLATAREKYAELGHGDIEAAVVDLRERGYGRENVARQIRHQLDPTYSALRPVFTTGMVELIEYAVATRASAS